MGRRSEPVRSTPHTVAVRLTAKHLAKSVGEAAPSEAEREDDDASSRQYEVLTEPNGPSASQNGF